MECSTPGFLILHCLLDLAQTHDHWTDDAVQPSHPLLSPSPPALHISQHQVLFQWVSSLHQVAKVLELQLSISPSSEYSGLISFRIDWLDLLAVQETHKSLLQHHSSKASIPRCSAFFMVQLSRGSMTAGKTTGLIMQTFCQQVMSLLFHMLFVIALLPVGRRLSLLWLQLVSAVIFEPRKITLYLFALFPHLFAVKCWDRMPWYWFSECWILSQLFHAPLSLSFCH